jgi:hypothetical protein
MTVGFEVAEQSRYSGDDQRAALPVMYRAERLNSMQARPSRTSRRDCSTLLMKTINKLRKQFLPASDPSCVKQQIFRFNCEGETFHPATLVSRSTSSKSNCLNAPLIRGLDARFETQRFIPPGVSRVNRYKEADARSRCTCVDWGIYTAL